MPYTMAYLYDAFGTRQESAEWFNASYWTASELKEVIQQASKNAGVSARISSMRDRSILVGRHMSTKFFKECSLSLGYQVNRLFDRDYRGETDGLSVDLKYLESSAAVAPDAYARILEYRRKWQAVVDMMAALMRNDSMEVRRQIESAEACLSEELRMLAWLFRNADRFPVVDFWASVMGPQVACVLRNLEMSLDEGLGCGHSLLCLVEVNGDAPPAA